MAAPSSTQALSPIPEDPATRSLIDSIVGFRHSDGRYDLRRDLTTSERTQLKGRASTLTAHMKSASADYIVNCVLVMLIGFAGGRSSADDAKAIASQYAAVLYGLPGWAIKRSCNLWANGHVTPEQIGAKKIDRSFAPSAAQVRMVAEEVIRPFMQEYARINKTLLAVVAPRELTREERDASADRLQAIADDLANRNLANKQAEEAAKEGVKSDYLQIEGARKAARRDNAMILAEYEARGIEPPPGNLVCLSTLIGLGWTIEDGCLIKPKEKKGRGKTKGSRVSGDESRTVAG